MQKLSGGYSSAKSGHNVLQNWEKRNGPWKGKKEKTNVSVWDKILK